MKTVKTGALIIEGKPWYKSKTVYAGIATIIIGGLAAYYGEAHWLVAGLTVVAGAFGVYGRVTAETKVDKKIY